MLLCAMPLLLVLSTFPSADSARAAAAALVGESLAACVNLLPGVESIYRWEGKIEQSAEVLAFIKITAAAWPDLQRRLRELHPYDVPEIVALNPAQVSPDYLRWVCASVEQ
jgi:periplasmic divalent cation tolerance protein